MSRANEDEEEAIKTFPSSNAWGFVFERDYFQSIYKTQAVEEDTPFNKFELYQTIQLLKQQQQKKNATWVFL